MTAAEARQRAYLMIDAEHIGHVLDAEFQQELAIHSRLLERLLVLRQRERVEPAPDVVDRPQPHLVRERQQHGLARLLLFRARLLELLALLALRRVQHVLRTELQVLHRRYVGGRGGRGRGRGGVGAARDRGGRCLCVDLA